MSDAVFYICLTLVVIIFAGDPDLMDAIQNYLNSAGGQP